MMEQKTIYSCRIQSTKDRDKEDILPPDENSVAVMASFYLEDVSFWHERNSEEYPCIVYFYDGTCSVLHGVTYEEFDDLIVEFQSKKTIFKQN